MKRSIRLLAAGALLAGAVVAAVLFSAVVPLDFAVSDNHTDGEIDVRVQARQTASGRVELRAQSRLGRNEWMTHTPDARFLPTQPEPGKWYSSNSIGVSLPAPAPDVSDEAAYTQSFVAQAIDYHQRHGLEATLSHYNSPESVDGQWYVFILDQDDVFIAHENANLLGMAAAEVNGPNQYPVGRIVVAAASVQGAWVDYPFNNPTTGQAEIKHSWIVRHDGLIFGSGWYEPAPSKTRAPGAYTQSLVASAIELYDVLGRDALVEHYNTPESADGSWYVFVIGEDGRNLAHQVPDLIGLVTAEVDVDGYPAGAMVVAAASDEGAWVDYQYTNLETNRSETKHSWVVKHQGLIIGSGWYETGPSKEHEPAGYAQALVERSLELYRLLGREALIEYHNSPESLDGEWYVFIIDSNGTRLAHPFLQVGVNILDGDPDTTGYNFRADIVAVEDRDWVSYVFENPETGEQGQKHTWVIRHDGLLFAAGWYEAGVYEAPDP